MAFGKEMASPFLFKKFIVGDGIRHKLNSYEVGLHVPRIYMYICTNNSLLFEMGIIK
jgi:hypothetical protein